ncbi:hypothetical protein TCAL_15678 [Tigriopus californicus]|uniref:Uncharacterized protein n=1 Tax=Tigriopus californicus TaxID=6832 RepID=A0A553PA72_TIGCA|nr:hypothetical protein TCAL_15678 [Tigriopus californicus]
MALMFCGSPTPIAHAELPHQGLGILTIPSMRVGVQGNLVSVVVKLVHLGIVSCVMAYEERSLNVTSGVGIGTREGVVVLWCLNLYQMIQDLQRHKRQVKSVHSSLEGLGSHHVLPRQENGTLSFLSMLKIRLA